MLKQLNSLEALKFKHEVHGLLISYIERSQAKVKVHIFPLFTQSIHPASQKLIATGQVFNQALFQVQAPLLAVLNAMLNMSRMAHLIRHITKNNTTSFENNYDFMLRK
ncbi:hypothetical protein PoB_004535700 [Plakobranchus ocellatus]|uniref:Uncharacterized protein n=1 Tax=Plakobranchus ocellatus TaxID=259542 RepID=A0AAV4BHS9_9GAST|nr:hypothetical protein PoB_004535700 [Plakobranchus ocellatus]